MNVLEVHSMSVQEICLLHSLMSIQEVYSLVGVQEVLVMCTSYTPINKKYTHTNKVIIVADCIYEMKIYLYVEIEQIVILVNMQLWF